MKLYFTRHGKTQWNLEHRLQGMYGDSPLLADSYQDIALLGEYLKEIPFEKIYSSTAKRASDTAQGIAAKSLYPMEILYKDSLRELGFGEIEGQRFDDLTLGYQKQMHDLRHHLDRYDPNAYFGETVTQAIKRLTETVYQAVAENEGPLLFVGHGAALTMLIQHLIGKSPADYRNMGGLDNNSVTLLESQKTKPYRLIQWNETDFLRA